MKNKIIVIASITGALCFAGSAFAQQENQGDKFAAHKKQIINDIGKQKAILDQEIACVNSAQNIKSAKSCHQKTMADMKELRNQIKQQREEMKQKMQSRKNSKERDSQEEDMQE